MVSLTKINLFSSTTLFVIVFDDEIEKTLVETC